MQLLFSRRIGGMSRSDAYINKLNYWFLANKLCINIDKTCYTVFGPGRVDKDTKINLAGTNIQRVTSCKYLGVLTDEELKWVENIEYIHNNIIKYIGIFYKLQNILQFYVVFIVPLYILTYCTELRSMVMQVLHN